MVPPSINRGLDEMLEEELARSGQIDEATKQRRKERQQQALREQLQGYLCK